jgi:uncharacterized protein DUF5615
MALLYADENFHRKVVDQLQQLGHDVVTALQAGKANQKIPDADVLAYAISQKRAVLTFNRRHFIGLHGQVQPHCGIIVCTKDPDVQALADRIHQAIVGGASLDNQLIRITKPP